MISFPPVITSHISNITSLALRQGPSLIAQNLICVSNTALQYFALQTSDANEQYPGQIPSTEVGFPIENSMGQTLFYGLACGAVFTLGAGLLHRGILNNFRPDYFNEDINQYKNRPDLMFSENNIFIGLIHSAISNENISHKNSAKAVYELYLRDERIVKYIQKDEFGSYGENKVDWEDEHAANYILLSPEPDGPAMILSQNALQLMLKPERGQTGWNSFYLYNSQGESVSSSEFLPEVLFHQLFPIFSKAFEAALQSERFSRLLSLVLQQDPELHLMFVNATRQSHSDSKLVDQTNEQRLKSTFSPFLEYRLNSGIYQLTAEHFNDIMKEYSLVESSNSDQAKILMSLSAAFTKFSSSAFFGTEYDSPETLRFYAHALMEKAYALDKTLFNDGKSNAFADWKNRQLGLEGAFSCSAILSRMMVEHIKSRFPDVLAKVMPPVWM